MQRKWLQFALLQGLGLSHGMVFAFLPSVSNVLTSPDYYNLTHYQYALLYIPWILGFIFAWSYAGESKKWRPILGAGLGLMAFGLLFFALSNVTPQKYPLNLVLLNILVGMLGAGLGFCWPSLKAFEVVHKLPFSAITVSMGVGAALSPLLVNLFFSEGLWWLAPICLLTGLVLLFNFAIFLPILDFPKADKPPKRDRGLIDLSWTFWLFITVVLLFAFCKSAFGTWIPIYMGSIKKLTFEESNQALAAFWLASTVVQMLITLAIKKISFRWFFGFLPLAVFWVLGILPEVRYPSDLFIASAIAGAACSGFFTLSILFAESTQARGMSLVSKGLTMAYCGGFLLGSFGLGELQHVQKIPLEAIFFFASLPAALMTILAWIILYFFPRTPSNNEKGV